MLNSLGLRSPSSWFPCVLGISSGAGPLRNQPKISGEFACRSWVSPSLTPCSSVFPSKVLGTPVTLNSDLCLPSLVKPLWCPANSGVFWGHREFAFLLWKIKSSQVSAGFKLSFTALKQCFKYIFYPEMISTMGSKIVQCKLLCCDWY